MNKTIKTGIAKNEINFYDLSYKDFSFLASALSSIIISF